MAYVVGENQSKGESKNMRFTVTVTVAGKVLYTTVGMLHKDAGTAERWAANNYRTMGVALPKGAVLEAKPAKAR